MVQYTEVITNNNTNYYTASILNKNVTKYEKNLIIKIQALNLIYMHFWAVPGKRYKLH